MNNIGKTQEWFVEEIDLQSLGENEIKELYDFSKTIMSELHPMTDYPSFEVFKKGFSKNALSSNTRNFFVRSKSVLVAKAQMGSDEKKGSWLRILVKKENRREGIGTAILKKYLDTTKFEKDDRLYAFTNHESGYSFFTKLNARIIATRYFGYLKTTDTDWEKIQKLNDELSVSNPEITIDITKELNGVDRENFLNLLVDFEKETRQYYENTKEFDKEKFLEKYQKIWEENKKKGTESIFVLVKKSDESLVGMSEYWYNLNVPENLFIPITGISKKYRGRGLCKLLKANSLLYIKSNLPKVTTIQTANDDKNKAILRVNEIIGFKKSSPNIGYDFDVAELKKTLGLS